MNTCIFLPLSFLALTLSTSALGECTAQVREFIGNSGGTKAKAIAKAKDLNAGLRRAGPIAQLSKKERMEWFAFGDEQEKELIADIQSCTERDLASINPSSTASAASNCPSVYSYGFSAGCGSKLSVLPNGHIGYNGCPEAGDPYKDQGPIEKVYKDRNGSDHPGLDSWLECQLAARKGNSAPTNTSASGTKTQINVENAGEVNGRKEAGKSAWKRGDSQTSQSQSQQKSDTDAQGSNGSPKSKYVSKDATHCVEMVPKGFKCDGPYDRFLTNICMTKISVRWRLGSDPWGMQKLAPKGCTPVSPFRDQRGVQFKACSWDPKASHAPYSDPCRY